MQIRMLEKIRVLSLILDLKHIILVTKHKSIGSMGMSLLNIIDSKCTVQPRYDENL